MFVPAHPVTRHGAREVGLELRRSPDGRPAVPAFSTLSKLVSALGTAQPWVLMPLRAARAPIRPAGADEVILDPARTRRQRSNASPRRSPP
ncbi:MAG TPA: SAV_915 family protein [Pseudonocardiaceae bacterium]|nr:SAV_915 family protein [Pseudonocardiaceae bacterium]